VGTGSEGSFTCTAPNAWGCGYIYGFRVPFLVVSEYTGTALTGGGYGGYISGPCRAAGQPTCPNTNQIYQHDFGSILAFTEFNFQNLGLNFIAPPYYADYNALDAYRGNVPLSDFFPLYTGTSSASRSFFQIPVSDFPSSFENYYSTNNATPAGPDPD
jgi:hypothetical protein